MRILTIANVPPDPDSGAAGTVYHTNSALRELGHEVDEVWQAELGTPVITHGNLHALLEQPFRYRAAVKSLLKRDRYDVIQISQPQGYLAAKWLKANGFQGVTINRSHGLELAVNAIVPYWHKKLKVPESSFPRSLLTPAIRYLLSLQWPAAVNYFDGVVLPSGMDYDELVRRFPVHRDKCICIHHGVGKALAESEPPPLTSERAMRLLYVGQYAFVKGYPILTRVLEQSLRKHPALTCTWITGKAGHAEVLREIPADLQGRVRLREWVKHEALQDVYDQHGIFLFPSFFEGAGKAALEAMSRRMYVISSDVGAMRDYAKESGGCILCPTGDVDAFCRSIDECIDDVDEASRIADKGYRMAKTKTWKRCAEQLDQFYRRLMLSAKSTQIKGQE